MTHEFKELIETALTWQRQGVKSVLATVVALDGSSYRRPGVRMLLSDRGSWVGAVSGGCVEKEVYRQAHTVFQNGTAKVITYDGRFRLGCEGILYILLEPFFISDPCAQSFQNCMAQRTSFRCNSYYHKTEMVSSHMGSILLMEGEAFQLNPSKETRSEENLNCFSQQFSALFQLYIFGAEHDAVQLCHMANQLGWEVHVIAPPDEAKSLDYFKGATTLKTPLFDAVDVSAIDEQSAVMLMTHSFHKDIQYLMALKSVVPAYLGLLGPAHRRERLFEQFLIRYPNTHPEFFERIHGPAGINLGAESAAEIALSILAEILGVVRQQKPFSLRDKVSGIHD